MELTEVFRRSRARLILVSLLQMLTLPISLMFCGHLGTVDMDAVSMAVTARDDMIACWERYRTAVESQFISWFFGALFLYIRMKRIRFSLKFLDMFGVYATIGMTTACYTIFSQLFGSPAKANMGLMLQRGLLVLVLGCVPLAALLINVEFLMILAGQNAIVSRKSGQFLNIAVIGLPGMAIWNLLRSYTYTQGIIHAHYIILLVSDLVNVGFHLTFVTLLGMGYRGAALSYCLTNWLIAGLYLCYIILMKSYEGLWTGWTIECIDNLGEFMKMGIFGMATFVVESGAYEIITLIVAQFRIIEQDAFCTAYTLLTIFLAIPQGLVYGAFVRVGHHLGANNPTMAKCAFQTSALLTIPTCITFPVALVCFRQEIPYIFTNNRDVANVSSVYSLWTALILVVYGLQMPLKGMLGSLGRQSYAAVVNIFVYLILGVGLAFPLMLKTSLGVEGGFVALTVTPLTQIGTFLFRLMTVDWEKEAIIAQERAGDVNNQYTQSQITTKEMVNIPKPLDSSDTPTIRTNDEHIHALNTKEMPQLSGYGATMSTHTDIKTLRCASGEILSGKDKGEARDGEDGEKHRKRVLVNKFVTIISVSVAIIAASVALNRFLAKLLV